MRFRPEISGAGDGMNLRAGGAAPCRRGTAAISCLMLAVCGCSSMRGLETVGPAAGSSAPMSPERAVAIAEMRAEAEAGDRMPFPDPYQAAQSRRLALRGEPRSYAEVQSIQAELTLIAARRAAATDPG